MKLYWLAAENRYVHRQADIPKGVASEVRDIPTDLMGLMRHLNALLAQAQASLPEREVSPPPEAPPPPQLTERELQLNVEEAIQAADAAQLASYAEGVCWRIKELSNALKAV